VCVCECVCVLVCVRAYACVHMCMYARAYVCVCMCVLVYACMYICMRRFKGVVLPKDHTHTHTHTHTHKRYNKSDGIKWLHFLKKKSTHTQVNGSDSFQKHLHYWSDLFQKTSSSDDLIKNVWFFRNESLQYITFGRNHFTTVCIFGERFTGLRFFRTVSVEQFLYNKSLDKCVILWYESVLVPWAISEWWLQLVGSLKW